MLKAFLSILIISQGLLLAHCDGCGTPEHKPEGSLVGNVKYQGKVPKPKPLKMDSDPICGASHDGRVTSESFIVDDDMNLKNVLIWFKNVSYSGETEKTPAVIDQKGCLYNPHVLGVMKDQQVLIKNSDKTLHNIHSMPNLNTPFNSAQPAGVPDLKKSFTSVEEPFYIKCDVHPWMKSWVLVQDHPFFAVTDENGNYRIDNIPPGTYEVIAWQEKFKIKRTILKTVEIKDTIDTTQDFVFIKPEKK